MCNPQQFSVYFLSKQEAPINPLPHLVMNIPVVKSDKYKRKEWVKVLSPQSKFFHRAAAVVRGIASGRQGTGRILSQKAQTNYTYIGGYEQEMRSGSRT